MPFTDEAADTLAHTEVYAAAQNVSSVEDCYFYHAIDLPGYGTIPGDWDLRGNTRAYMGDVDLAGKRVLEIGAANGFLTFWMEQRGAEVVAFDLSPNQPQDIVPFAADPDERARITAAWHDAIRRVNRAFWLAHRTLHSRAKVVYGTVYTVPEAIGPVDVATFGAVLLHVRDPFLALQNALRLTRETVIVTDVFPFRDTAHRDETIRSMTIPENGIIQPDQPLDGSEASVMVFHPRFWDRAPYETWWHLTPEVVRRMIGVLGFEETAINYHIQPHRTNGPTLFYTIVGRRTRRGT